MKCMTLNLVKRTRKPLAMYVAWNIVLHAQMAGSQRLRNSEISLETATVQNETNESNWYQETVHIIWNFSVAWCFVDSTVNL